VGSAMGAALTNKRLLGPTESGLLVKMAFAALVFAMVTLIWPRVVAIPLGIIVAWIGFAMLGKAMQLRRVRHRAKPRPTPGEGV